MLSRSPSSAIPSLFGLRRRSGNAINIALPLFECPNAARAIQEGATIGVDFAAGLITDERTGAVHRATSFPPFLQEMIAVGGPIPYSRRRLGRG